MSHATPRSDHQPMTSRLLRGAIWIAIGALIAAALVCVVWVLIGDQDGIIGRAFLTILLLALFAGMAIAEAHLAQQRPDWLALTSMISWIVVLLVGAVKIWLPGYEFDDGWIAERFFQFLLVIGILQLALVHVRLFMKASQRYVTVFTQVVTLTTFALLAVLVGMLVFYLTFPDSLRYGDLYWRIVIAVTILTAVGTTLIPLLNALFAPRQPRSQLASGPQGAAPLRPWPTYPDGRTPLPMAPDGSPDWNAYRVGRPGAQSAPAHNFPASGAAQGFPAPGAAQGFPVPGAAHGFPAPGGPQSFPAPPSGHPQPPAQNGHPQPPQAGQAQSSQPQPQTPQPPHAQPQTPQPQTPQPPAPQPPQQWSPPPSPPQASPDPSAPRTPPPGRDGDAPTPGRGQ